MGGDTGVVGGVHNKPSKGPMGIAQYVYVSSEKEHHTAQGKAQSLAPLPGPSPWPGQTEIAERVGEG